MENRQSNRPQAIFQYVHHDFELTEDQHLQHCFYTFVEYKLLHHELELTEYQHQHYRF